MLKKTINYLQAQKNFNITCGELVTYWRDLDCIQCRLCTGLFSDDMAHFRYVVTHFRHGVTHFEYVVAHWKDGVANLEIW